MNELDNKMKTVFELQALTANDLDTAAKNGMTEAQMKGFKVATWDRRIVSDAEVIAIFADRAASLAAFDRIAAMENTGEEFVSYTDEFVAALKNVIVQA